jgi:hypothetical protein
MTSTIVVRVDDELKRKLRARNVRISDVVRSALREEIEKREKGELVSALREAKHPLSKVPDSEITRAVREARDGR